MYITDKTFTDIKNITLVLELADIVNPNYTEIELGDFVFSKVLIPESYYDFFIEKKGKIKLFKTIKNNINKNTQYIKY